MGTTYVALQITDTDNSVVLDKYTLKPSCAHKPLPKTKSYNYAIK
jgi:hypothetical protein